MRNYFEIIDDGGVISSPFSSFEDAAQGLEALDNDPEFEQQGDLKIVEVYFIRA